MADYSKISDTQIKKTEVITKTKENTYDINFLISQKAQIEGDIKRNQEALKEVEDLLAECEKHGIKPTEKEIKDGLKDIA